MPTPPPAAATPAGATVRRARGAPPRPRSSTAPAADVFYPSSDGKPMAENMWQARAIVSALGDLERAHPQALVAADILVYPEKGNNRNSIAPDVLVALGLGTHERMNYLVWEEGKPPDWVLEVASPTTEQRDRCIKRCRYATMGVPEYWLFDPKGDVFRNGKPRLRGLALVDGEYSPLESRLVAGKRVIRSEVLSLDVCADGKLLRFRDPATGEDIRHVSEVVADVERAEARAMQEAIQRTAAEARTAEAEARIAELEAALRRSQAGDRR